MDERIIENSERKISDIAIIKRTLKYLHPYRFKFAFALLLMLVMVVLDLLGPIFTRNVISLVSVEGIVDINGVFLNSFFFLICITMTTLLIYITTMMLQKIGQSVIYDLRMIVFEHIDNLSISQLNEIPVGSLVTRLTSDTNALSDLFTHTIPNLIKNIILIIGVVVFMFFLDSSLAIYICIFIPLILVVSIVFRKFSRENYRKVRSNFSIMNAFLNESLSGMKIIQIFNQEKRKEKEFDELNKKIVKSRVKDVYIFGLYRPIITFLYFTCIGLCFYVGLSNITSYPVVSEDPNVLTQSAVFATVFAFYSYISKFFGPVQDLADQLNALQRAFTSCERLYNLLDTKPIINDRPNSIHIDHFEGKIEFKHVWFAYKDEEWILKDVSFIINPKQVVAFVGATGAGKTTILQLIVRNYEVQKGEILIDGINVNDIDIKCLRRGIGQMLQDVFLFSGTIKSNIALRDEDISLDDINEAIKYVNADIFINKLENGINEEVQERGENFSAGQRQLLSFARTVVHKPQIIFLDEATANIDTETEKIIQDSLYKMMNIGTMLIVAHRLSTIQHADKIICLQHGEIIEQGNHQELLKKHGYYYNLYQLQFDNRD